eukprot:XP_027303983.1 butyrophilin subfamily 1 member A1-like [Anas platyrhynchos]
MDCDQLSPLLPAWRKFLLPHNTLKVTLDPDTAHPHLVVSQDNSSVRRESERQQVSEIPERFDCWCCVLGREEFREGRHCWQVEMDGEWHKYSWWAQVSHISSHPLSLSPIPTRIWVCLDCTQQQVSFINADNGVEIFTFTAASFNGESIRPWFWLWTEGFQLCLRDRTPQTLSPALGGSCPSPDTPASPLLGSAGPAQE